MSSETDRNPAAKRRHIRVDANGVTYIEIVEGTEARRAFTFGEIECVLLSDQGLLSFQVGGEVFSIRLNPQEPRHQNVINALVVGVRRTVDG